MFQLSCAVLCFFICFRLVFSEPLTYRLSKEAIPTTYRLTVKPDFENEIFHGEMFIFVKTKDSLDGITLHSYELNISDVYINQLKGYYENGTEDRITVKYTEGHIQPGEHTIHIKYTGKIRRTVGFIKALSGNTENQAYVFVTDLEPNRARRVFPCFDEPSFKANFNIKLISPNETVKAISNMPEIKNFTTSKGVVYEFATSIKMSTYLVSFAFTNFPFYEENFEYKGRNIPIRIYTVNASKENNEFAIDCTKKALTFYSDYTNISYPLPKLDMIEYRRNESAATENWGLITFREGLLTPSLHIYNKFQVQLVVFHELGHFWFGNLVTNDWWNDVWLQEGFATYMSYKLLALDYNRPQLSEMKSFNFDDFLETEIYEDTRPIVTYLPNQSKLTDVFNGMVYEKASALLLMLEEEIGEDNFKEVIRRFLKKHAYATATTNDFITTLEEVVPNKPLRMFLETYLFQNKFPVIEVDILENSTYVLKQQICETLLNDSASHSKWSIPITYKVDSKNITGPIWFDSDMEELRIDEPNAKWIIFNPKGNGMYKTVWSKNLWPKIIDNFALMDFSTSETVISDAYYSFRFNKIGCDIVIRLMEQAKEKRELMSFFTFFDHLKENLFCEKYSYEATLFWTFLKQRFAKTGYKKNPVNREPESCNNKYIIKTENYLKNLSECANWIREHLKEEDSNMVKRNS